MLHTLILALDKATGICKLSAYFVDHTNFCTTINKIKANTWDLAQCELSWWTSCGTTRED